MNIFRDAFLLVRAFAAVRIYASSRGDIPALCSRVLGEFCTCCAMLYLWYELCRG